MAALGHLQTRKLSAGYDAFARLKRTCENLRRRTAAASVQEINTGTSDAGDALISANRLPPPRLKLDSVLGSILYMADFIGVSKGIRTPVTAVNEREW
jgi:hypothetical protein